MASNTSVINVRDGNNNIKNLYAIDRSGVGSGPFVPIQGLADESGNQIGNSNPLPVATIINNSTIDFASIAQTLTTISTPVAPSLSSVSYRVYIPVTAISGTTPSLDIIIQESDDGVNWSDVYHLPRIASTGIFSTPTLTFTSNLIRYVQNISGTTPSFTYSINRVQTGVNSGRVLRQIFDRSVSLTANGSITNSIATLGASNIQLELNIGAVTTPPSLLIQGSDDNGASWYTVNTLNNIDPTLVGSNNATVSTTINNVHAQHVRAQVVSPGVSVTPGYVLIKVFN